MKGDILKDYRLFEQILPYKDDKEFCKKYEKVKRNNKIRFAKYIKEKQGISLMISFALAYPGAAFAAKINVIGVVIHAGSFLIF